MTKAQKDVKGQGSIIQFEKDKPKSRCRKWQLRASTGKDPRTDKYITKTRTFHGSYTEATKALRGFIEEIEQDKIQGCTAYTFEEYCNRYPERREAKKEVALTTLRRQGCQFKAACHHIGGLKLEEVTPNVLDNMYVAMMQGETLSGKKSGGSYVNQIHDNITLVFEAAKNEGLPVSNPCDGANPPKMDTKAKKAIEPAKVHELAGELDPSNPHERLPARHHARAQARGDLRPLVEGHRLRAQHRGRHPQLRQPRQPQGDQDQGGHAPPPTQRDDQAGAPHDEAGAEGAVREDQPLSQAERGLPEADGRHARHNRPLW